MRLAGPPAGPADQQQPQVGGLGGPLQLGGQGGLEAALGDRLPAPGAGLLEQDPAPDDRVGRLGWIVGFVGLFQVLFFR